MGETVRYIDIASIDRETKRIVSPQVLDGGAAPSRARKIVRAGDVLVSMTRPNLNAVALVPDVLDGQIASTGFDVLRAPKVDPRWIFYAVRTRAFVDSMSELVQGALYPAVRSKDVRGFLTPIAPLAEQKRIADKLDALLTRVEACRERLDRVPAILKRFRQAILAAATSGELTRDWREKAGSRTADYPLCAMRDLVREPLRNGKSVRDGDGSLVLRLSSLRNGHIDWNEAKAGQWGSIDVNRFLVEEGDFLVVRGNGSRDLVGRGGLVVGTPPRVAFPDTMIRIRPDLRRVLPTFLQLVWDSRSTRDQIEFSARTTAGIWKIAQPDLERLLISLPEVREQEEIVRRSSELFEFANRLERHVNRAGALTQTLTPSALSKAFRGELVPQDPSDEPASILLARLRSEREAAPTPPRRRSRTRA
jgi:type I restriction enzyme S subunit